MTNIEQAREQIAAQEAGLTEHQVAVHDLRIEGRVLYSPESHWTIDKLGFKSLCNRFRAPVEYVSRLTAGMQAELLQYHIDRGDLGRGNLTLIAREGELFAFKRSDLFGLSGVDVLQAAVDGIGEGVVGLEVGGLHVTPESFRVDLLSEPTNREVSPGDVIRAGIRIEHSILGEFATVVEAYLLRLRCKNGMTHRECLGKKPQRTRRLPADWADAKQQQISQVRRLAQQAWQTLDEKLKAVEALQDQHVKVMPFLTRWVRQARLSTRNLLPRLERAWNDEGAEHTAFAAINSMTRIATHDEAVPARQRQILGRLAAMLSFRQLHWCEHCWSRLSV